MDRGNEIAARVGQACPNWAEAQWHVRDRCPYPQCAPAPLYQPPKVIDKVTSELIHVFMIIECKLKIISMLLCDFLVKVVT